MSEELKHERLLEILKYDETTGVFTWLVSRGCRRAGDVSGCPDMRGYLRIQIDKKFYMAHKLAWFYEHKRWPTNEIDHINWIAGDNRLSNLREATREENNQNIQGARKNSTTGILGVSLFRRGVWKAQIKANKKLYFLGHFDDPEKAREAYLNAKRILHPNAIIAAQGEKQP